MSRTSSLDDIERDIARTLHAKAGQLKVDDTPFLHAGLGHGDSTRVVTPRSGRRRVLAAAAALALLTGGVAIVRGWAADTTGPAETATSGAPESWLDETVAFRPGTDGWELQTVSVYDTAGSVPTSWQLFGARNDVPVPRGLVVGASDGPPLSRPEGGNYTIHGMSGTIGRPVGTSGASGTMQAVWGSDDISYLAWAVDVTEAEMHAAIESLVPRESPEVGFNAPAAGPLRLLESGQSQDQAISHASYAGPEGDLAIEATSPAPYVGLLQRLTGTPTAGGIVRTSGADEASPDAAHAEFLRDDGWSVTAGSGPGLPAEELSEIARGAQPVARRDLIAWAVEQPVTETVDVGDWAVRVHGNVAGDTGVCVTPPSGEEVCTTAEPSLDYTTASVPVGRDWVVVAITNAPDRPLVRIASDGPGSPGNGLDGETARAEGRVVEVVTVPEDVQVVEAGSWDSFQGLEYERPSH